MDELIKPRMEAEKQKLVEAAREEALENAISAVKAKIKEEQELEKAKGKCSRNFVFFTYVGIAISVRYSSKRL